MKITREMKNRLYKVGRRGCYITSSKLHDKIMEIACSSVLTVEEEKEVNSLLNIMNEKIINLNVEHLEKYLAAKRILKILSIDNKI